MKTFLTTMKGKIIAGIATVAVIGAVAAVVVVMNSGYRTIAVEELNGITRILNQGGTNDAYVGLHLKSGDDVTVTSESDMTLSMDTDKYMFAKENTHFWVEAKGKQSETRTKVHLDEGSTLCRIDNKLTSKESFDVETPNATMSVRGTVYRVSCYKGTSGDTYTVVDVLEGEVFVQAKMENGESTEESRLLPAGKRAIIRSDPTISEFVKVKDYEKIEVLINPKRPAEKTPGKDTTDVENPDEPEENTENVESENGSGNGEGPEAIDEYVGDVDYSTFEQNEAIFLGKAMDEGRSLSISKELLYDIVELIEHDFSGKSEEVAATCEGDGYYYDICTICGLKGNKHISTEKLGHDYVAKGGDDTVEICKNCGKEIQKEIPIEVEPEEETVAEPVAPVVIETPVNIPEAGDGTTAPVVEEPVVEEEKVEEKKPSSSSSGSSSSSSGSSSSSSGSSGGSSSGSSEEGAVTDPIIDECDHSYKDQSADKHKCEFCEAAEEHTFIHSDTVYLCKVCGHLHDDSIHETVYRALDEEFHYEICNICGSTKEKHTLVHTLDEEALERGSYCHYVTCTCCTYGDEIPQSHGCSASEVTDNEDEETHTVICSICETKFSEPHFEHHTDENGLVYCICNYIIPQ